MLVGTLAISGVPFFSGFYSKDAILAAAMARVWQSPEHFLLFLLPAVGAMLTAFYMFRMWFLTFAGEPRGFASRRRGGSSQRGRRGAGHSRMQDAAHGHGAGTTTTSTRPPTPTRASRS